jgi:hypothetical protein
VLNASNLASGTIPNGRFPAIYPAGSGINLTSITCDALVGTLPDIIFPSTLPSTVGINASTNLTAGFIPDACFPAVIPAVSGALLTNIVISQIGGMSAEVKAWLADPTSAKLRAAVTDESGAGALMFVGSALGTPASGTLTNCGGLPLAGVTGFAADVAAWLAAPSSANLRTAMTDEVGTGSLYFVGGALGTPASGVLTNCTGTASGLTAGAVTTNANLTGHITSVGNAAVLGSFTLAQLSTAVSDANIARTDAGQTFAGAQVFSSSIETTATDAVHTIRGQTLNLTADFVNFVMAGGFNAQGGTWTMTNTGVTATIAGDAGGAVDVTATTFRVNGHDMVDADSAQTVQAKTFTGCVFIGQQNPQTGNYTLALSDADCDMLHPAGAGAGDVLTIPANSSVPFEVGTRIRFINRDTTNAVSIAINTDTLRLSPGGDTGTRTLAAFGMAEAVKISSTEWMISGTGLT